MNSFVGPATSLPALGGLLVDATRPEAIFLVAIASGVAPSRSRAGCRGRPALEAKLGPKLDFWSIQGEDLTEPRIQDSCPGARSA
jgi:hypothetical protein